jgi:hypothetical protein
MSLPRNLLFIIVRGLQHYETNMIRSMNREGGTITYCESQTSYIFSWALIFLFIPILRDYRIC